MTAEAWINQIITSGTGHQAHGSVPPKIPDPFILHTATGATPVPNGPVTASGDLTVAVSVTSKSPQIARETAQKALKAISTAYDSDTEAAGEHLAYFTVQMLPTRQPSATSAVTPTWTQYDAIYRMIFTR